MSRDLAVDLGTANAVVRSPGKGVLVREPALVAVDERTGEVLGFGEGARGVLGDDGRQAAAMWPLRRGAVTDYYVTDRLFRALLKRAGGSRLVKPRVMVSIPSVLTPVERRALEEAAYGAGARSVLLISSPLAAALGGGLAIDEPHGLCVMDVGGGVTECVVLALGGLVSSRMVKMGGFDMDEAIQRMLRRDHEMAIGERAAEELKIAIGSAMPLAEDVKAEVRGRDLATGAPKTAIVSAEEIRAALDEPVQAIIVALRETLAETPPELAHDVLERGITLCGGGALLEGLAQRITEETSIPVRLTEEPLDTVSLGIERAFGSLASLVRAGMVEQV
ncbi:MAG: rod shape-determining protein [Actinomycetota bacterium]|nr:rod shape-determining protein [Actinomycetota bacterium]